MSKSTIRSLLGLVAVLSLPSASYGACVKYQGFLSCDGGTSGFSDSSGNVWTQDRRGRQGVILNLDRQEPQERSRGVIIVDGDKPVTWDD